MTLADIPYLGPPDKSSSGDNVPPTRIVIHCTVSGCVEGQARRTAEWFRDSRAGGSAHFAVDPGEVVRCARDNVICWHAPPNSRSLGVEFCDPMPGSESNQLDPGRWDDKAHVDMLELGAALVAALAKKHDIPITRLSPEELRAGKKGVCGHDDVSDAFHQSSHWDPGKFFPWRRFMAMVKAAGDGRDPVEPDGLTREERARLRELRAAAFKRINELEARLDNLAEKRDTAKDKLDTATDKLAVVVDKLAQK